MSSEIFENREEDYKLIVNDLKKKVERDLPHNSGEGQKRLRREIDRGLEEANILLHEMEEEARKAPPKFRMDMLSSVRNHRAETEQITRDMRKATEFGMRPATSGFYDDEDEFEQQETSQRARLLQGNRHLNEASNSIARSHQIATETEEIGVDIIDDLGSQRESLIRTRERLHDTDSHLSRSRKLLLRMGRGVLANKFLLALIIFLELAILGGVVYWKFFS